MGIFYHYAIVHNRLLIWWTDYDGVNHEEWFWGEEANKFFELENTVNNEIQNSLCAIIRHANIKTNIT